MSKTFTSIPRIVGVKFTNEFPENEKQEILKQICEDMEKVVQNDRYRKNLFSAVKRGNAIIAGVHNGHDSGKYHFSYYEQFYERSSLSTDQFATFRIKLNDGGN